MNIETKIQSLADLAVHTARLRSEGKLVVLCHGIFDMLHVGHIRYLTQAKAAGDVLVVVLAPDRVVGEGLDQPAFSERTRAEVVASVACVDYVAIGNEPTAAEAIKLLRPHVYARGADYPEAHLSGTEKIVEEDLAIQLVGGRIEVTDEITTTSAQFIRKHLRGLPRGATEYIEDFAQRRSLNRVLQYIEEARALKVLVVGETIIDEYQYCETVGKSGKEPTLAARYVSSEKFAGGILAVANHVAAMTENVGMVTVLGADDSQEDFINEKLSACVDRTFLYLNNAPTIVKRRFVEMYPFQKLFEVYVMRGEEDNAALSEDLCSRLDKALPEYDVVIVTDYGHGMLGPEAVDLLCRKSRFLAVNTQVNADNRGFNTISKYPRADYICLSESEMRMEARSRRRDLRSIVAEVAERMSCPRVLVTRGQQGCLGYGVDEGFVEVPALTGKIVDRVGAGDAVLSVTTLCAAQGAPIETISFVGNAVGAQAVTIMGNRSSIQRESLVSFISALRK